MQYGGSEKLLSQSRVVTWISTTTANDNPVIYNVYKVVAVVERATKCIKTFRRLLWLDMKNVKCLMKRICRLFRAFL